MRFYTTCITSSFFISVISLTLSAQENVENSPIADRAREARQLKEAAIKERFKSALQKSDKLFEEINTKGDEMFGSDSKKNEAAYLFGETTRTIAADLENALQQLSKDGSMEEAEYQKWIMEIIARVNPETARRLFFQIYRYPSINLDAAQAEAMKHALLKSVQNSRLKRKALSLDGNRSKFKTDVLKEWESAEATLIASFDSYLMSQVENETPSEAFDRKMKLAELGSSAGVRNALRAKAIEKTQAYPVRAAKEMILAIEKDISLKPFPSPNVREQTFEDTMGVAMNHFKLRRLVGDQAEVQSFLNDLNP